MVYRNPYDGYSEGEYSPYSGQEEQYGGREQQYYTTQQAQVAAGWMSEDQGGSEGPTATMANRSSEGHTTSHRGSEGHTTSHRGSDGPTLGHRTSEGHRSRSHSSPHTEDSQANLISTAKEQEKWPRSSDHLFSCWAFTLSLHSLWTLPMVVIQQGGLAFLLIYTAMVALLGAPLLLLELSLGQYSALTPSRLYRHLCPILAGLGLSLSLMATVRGMLDLAVLMWSGQALFHLFSYQKIGQEFFSRDILDREDSSLEELGDLRNQILLVLGIATLSTFVFIVAGTRSVGKICMVAVPTAFMLLVTLTIRACLAAGGPQGVLLLLAPDWSVLTQPGAWSQAAVQVVFSLQLGLGALTTFSSYNKYEHNLVRDGGIVVVAHLVWVLLSVVLTLALLGLAKHEEPAGLVTGGAATGLLSTGGQGIWLAAVTLGEQAFNELSYGWLWAGLYFILVIIVGVTSLFGYVEVITSSLVGLRPSYSRFKPLLSFLVLAVLFLLDLLLATQGGIHVYHLLTTYIASWPALLFSLLTVLAAILCHGTSYLLRDLGDMTRLRLPHWVTAHLAVIYYTFLPVTLTAALAWHLAALSGQHLAEPRTGFVLSLPEGWGLALAWGLAALALAPLLLGALVQVAWVRRGVPLAMHLKRLFKATDRYYRNEHLENVATSHLLSKRTTTRA